MIPRRKLGRSGPEVPALGFGLMRLPLKDPQASPMDPAAAVDADLVLEMIRTAVDRGVDYLDTAYPYHGGQSEAILGRALEGGLRSKVTVATKLPVWLAKTRDDCDRLLDEQLARLRTGRIDVYLLHALNTSRWPALLRIGILEFLERAIADGRIGHAGFSFHDERPLFLEIVAAFPWTAAQIQLNYFDRNYQAGVAGMKAAAERGVGVIVMEPLRGGKLAQRLPADVQALFDGHPPKRSPASWALRWAWDNPEVSIVLSGMTTPPQLLENVATAEDDARPRSLSDADRALIDRAEALLRSRSAVDCTACGYCLPCPAGVGIPQAFGLYNDVYMFDDPFGPAAQYNLYFPAENRPDRCTECGECLARCPQGIDIPARLKDVREKLGTMPGK